MFQSSMVAYPWDLMDEGLDAALDSLQGDIGVTGVSVWASTSPECQLRVRPLVPRCFRTDGGFCFQPDVPLYGDSRCRPATADWIKSRNPLAQIAEGCESRALAMRAIVSLTKIGGLAERHASVACKNVFGALSRRLVCLTNPDVQAFLIALVRDLASNYPIRALVLADLDAGSEDARDLHLPVEGDEAMVLRRLLSLCFCESCRQTASASGLDMASVHRLVEDLIDEGLNRAGDRLLSLREDISAEPALADFIRRQWVERCTLVERLVGASRCDVYVLRDASDSWETDSSAKLEDGGAGLITRIEQMETVAESSPRGDRGHELRIRLATVGRDDGTALVHAFSTAVERGFTGVELDHFGVLSPSRETSVRQAVRMARRAVRS